MTYTATDRARQEPACVYYLADPRTPRHPRYVGETKQPMVRAHFHCQAYRGNPELQAWKHELAAAGLQPVLVVVAWYPSKPAARAAEWRLIRRWRRRGLADCNTARDGEWEAWVCMCVAINRRKGVA